MLQKKEVLEIRSFGTIGDALHLHEHSGTLQRRDGLAPVTGGRGASPGVLETQNAKRAPRGQDHGQTIMTSRSDTNPQTENLPALPEPRFKIAAKTGGPLRRKLVAALGRPLGALMGLPELNAIYDLVAAREEGEDFLLKMFEVMKISYRVSDEDLARIPATGPAVVVANHPFGAVEGVLLMSLLSRVRSDFKVMGTHFLRLVSEIAHMLIFVDNFGGQDAQRSNIGPMKESLRCLRGGGLLAMFPAGGVSHMTLRKRRITDPAWQPSVARIIHKTQVPVVPVYFDGHNGPLFQLLGLVHPMLRTMMLPRELANKQCRTIDISIGSPIPYKRLAQLERDRELINYLRLRTYLLKQRYAEKQQKRFRIPFTPLSLPMKSVVEPAARPLEDIAPQVPAEVLVREIAALPGESLLLQSGSYQVYAAPGSAIPQVLAEIGRLRELTFRLVGEGTGKASDLDQFDDYYDHLFIWNEEQRNIVGAYRIGKTDEILAERGIEGLYTSTLFTFKPALFERMGKALEMGRSFVRPEYQKSYSALYLLWKGIGCYVLRNPDHVVLFGPVSISNDYSEVSKELIVRYLRNRDSISSLHKLVKPKSPPKLRNFKRHEVREFRNAFKSVEDVTEVITDLENEFKGIPVLLRQYLKLGGKILAFNVDPEFQNCIDGLIKVDVLQTPPKILGRYMGNENVELLLEYHAEKNGRPTA